MEISRDTKEVVKFLLDFSDGNLRKQNDLEIFLEIGAVYGLADLINEFIFNGASLWYISQSLKKIKEGDEISNKLNKELLETKDKLSSQIIEFLQFTDEATKEIIEKKYFNQSRGSLLNLIDLAHDLSQMKSLQNTIRTKK